MKIYLFGFICFSMVLFSCKEKRDTVSNTDEPIKILGKVNTDSTAPPIVIPYTQTPVKLTPVITSKPITLDESTGKEVITSLSSESGLPLGRYRQVLQDDRGILWMNNGSELVKYDGISFHSYKPPVKDLFIMKIFMDKEKNIWAAVLDEANNSKRTRRIICFYFDGYCFHKVPGGEVESVASGLNDFYFSQGPDKCIWIADNNRKKIMVYEGLQVVKTLDIKENAFKSITDLGISHTNAAWITDRVDTAVTSYDGSRFIKYTIKDGLPAARLWTTIPVKEDSFYINTLNGLYLYHKGKSTKIIDSTAPTTFFGSSLLLADSQKELWVRLRNDKVVKHGRSGDIIFGKDEGLDDGVSFSSHNQENIWAGTRNKLFRFYRPIVNFRDIFPNYKDDGTVPFLQDTKANYWYGSFGSGIYRYDGKGISQFFFSEKAAKTDRTDNNSIDDITEDKAGKVWISTNKGSLIRFDGGEFTEFSKFGSPEFPVYPFSLFIDSKDNIWFVIWNQSSLNGAGYFNGREIVCYNTSQGLPSNDVSSIYEDSKGMMWFGTRNGLSRFDGKTFTNFSVIDGLPDNQVRCLTEDAYGRLWIGTDNNGLSRFDGEKFVNYSKEEGLSSEVIYSLQKSADKKRFWMRTRAGITAMQFHSADSISFENLDELNGFPVKSYDFLADKDGVLWGSDESFNLKRIDYTKIKAQAKPFSIHLSNIRVNNVSVCWSNLLRGDKTDSLLLETEMHHRFGKILKSDALKEMKKQFGGVKFDSLVPFDFIPENLVLPYSANALSFEFAAIDPQFSKYTRYQYMLEGFDKSWSPLGRNNTANFGKLSEGRYRFRVKALNVYGLWSETSYSFRVLPPWSRTWWAYTLYALLFVSGIILFIRWRTIALKKEKIQLEEKVTIRTAQLNQSLENLKATQGQLIQSEKMASLGELTAGIAHEIQNPLNFVNNFSEVNSELIEEQKEALELGDISEAKNLANEIGENEKKIIHHGKRADSIVKGMLQHSRSSNGVKEPTDINALCDEYLRLAYHGLRAKDKSFNATLHTDFDESIGHIDIIPQDIGRVILNLINNAFYAAPLPPKGGFSDPDYKHNPTVWVSTKKIGDNILISVRDNGPGIPQKVLDKIFQPFFTTKPTGEGTGLGLSLSYDIVKAHGGEIKVETKENEGTIFTINLPAS